MYPEFTACILLEFQLSHSHLCETESVARPHIHFYHTEIFDYFIRTFIISCSKDSILMNFANAVYTYWEFTMDGVFTKYRISTVIL